MQVRKQTESSQMVDVGGKGENRKDVGSVKS